MLESAVRLALGAGELVAPGPQLSEHLALLQAQVLTSFWPMLLLGGATVLLVMLGMIRCWGWMRQGPQLSAMVEKGAGGASCKTEHLPVTALRTHNGTAGHGQQQQRVRQSHATKVPVNGHLLNSVGMREKKLLKAKKKKKAQCSEKGASKDHTFAEKDKLLEEEEGVWQTKMSSREKRHLRKERLKQKENSSRVSPGTLVVEAVGDGDGKGTIWPHAVSGIENNSARKGVLCESGTKTDGGSALRNSEATREDSELPQSEEDVFSNVGTWDVAEVKAYPVTFGTLPELSMELRNLKSKSSQDSPSQYHWNANLSFLTVDDAWLGQDDPVAVDLNSDWNAPTEEWGNWLGEEEMCTGAEREKQGLEIRTGEGPSEVLSMKHSSHAICTFFKVPLDPANNLPHNGVPVKKERRKRKKMRKET